MKATEVDPVIAHGELARSPTHVQRVCAAANHGGGQGQTTMGLGRIAGRWSAGVLLAATTMIGAVPGPGSNPVFGGTLEQTEVISVDPAGVPVGGSEVSAISDDGRFVVFGSYSDVLVEGDTNRVDDVFVRDRVTGETQRVSVSSSGEEANYYSGGVSSISADGRYVPFTSGATNLVADDTNSSWDAFVYDRTTQETQCVSVSNSGAQGDLDSFDPVISSDGRVVAFVSYADNLVRHDSNGTLDVFVRDLTTQRNQLVGVSSTGAQGHDGSTDPAISAHGRFVAFQSSSPDLVRHDTNQTVDVFVRDLAKHRTQRVSVSSDGTQGNGWSQKPVISAHGRFVVFGSKASNLVRRDDDKTMDVFVYDRKNRTTRLVNISSTGAQGNRPGFGQAISADGRFVAFVSAASNLVGHDTNEHLDVFVRDLTGRRTTRVSIGSSGGQGNHPSRQPAISAEGVFVSFSSVSKLADNDTNRGWDVYVRGPLH